jgi:K+-transporting ATPase ATPase C chain
MFAHLRANLWLFALTVLLCSGIYPLALWGVGQAEFPNQANGSLITGPDGKPVGSRLLAHEVNGDEYFQPRPSAVGYNAAGSGGSNWCANNYLLRDRVARALGPIVKYKSGVKKGQLAAPDVVKWFREEQPGVVADWAKAHGGLAQNWAKAEDATKALVLDWFKQHPDEMAAWKKENPDKAEPAPEDLAVAFFESFAKAHPGTWLTVAESKTEKNEKGEPVKAVELVKKESEDAGDIAAVFFDTWRQAHPAVELEEVPSDMVMASGSGLDPHITLANALYQLDRVAAARAKQWSRSESQARDEITELLRAQAEPPLGGLAGVPLVLVSDVNRALDALNKR